MAKKKTQTETPSTNEIVSLKAEIVEKDAQILALQSKLLNVENTKNGAYSERDRLVCALSKCFPSYLTKHPDDPTWEKDWMNIVVIDLPTGQASWHIHDSELSMFTHLETKENHWDGHSTEEKYNRLSQIDSKVSKDVSLDDLCIFYHEIASRALVELHPDLLITKPTTPFKHWNDLTDKEKEGRRVMMKALLKGFNISYKTNEIALSCDVSLKSTEELFKLLEKQSP